MLPEDRKESVVPWGRASSAVSRPISPVATNSSAKCVCNTLLSKTSPSSSAASSCYTATFRPSACGTGIESSRSISTCSSTNSSMSLKSIEFPSPSSKFFSNNSRSDSHFDVAESGVQQNPRFFALRDQRSAPSTNPSFNGSKSFDDFASSKQSELATAGPFSNSRHESEPSFRMVGSGLQNPTYLAQRDQRFGASARTSGLVGGNTGDFSQSVLQPYFCCEGSAPSSENVPSRSAGPAATQFTASGNARSTCNSFNPCGSLLAVGCNDGRVIFLDFITRGAAKTICAHNGPVCTISWSRNGRKVLTASTDNTVAIWDVLSGDCEERLWFPGPVLRAQFHPRDEKRLLVSPLKHAPVLLNLAVSNSKSMHVPLIEDELGPDVNIVASFDRKGNHVITGNGKGKVCVFASNGLQLKAFFRLPSNHAVKLITVCRRTDFFLTLSQDRAIRVYSMEKGLAKGISGEVEAVQTLQDLVSKTPWKTCCFSGDSEYVCAASASHHSLYIWERGSGSLVKILHGTKGEQLLDLTWHPLRPVICSIANGVVTIWAQSHVENWSAFAPDFKELDENAEYEERESEFDHQISDSGTILEFTGKHVTRKHGDVAFVGLNPSAEEQVKGTEELTESGIDLILNHGVQQDHVIVIDVVDDDLGINVQTPEAAVAWCIGRTFLFWLMAVLCLAALVASWVGHKQDVPDKLLIDRTSNMAGQNFNIFPAFFNIWGFVFSVGVAVFSGMDFNHKGARIVQIVMLVLAIICLVANFIAGGLTLTIANETVDRSKYSREEYDYQIDQHKLSGKYAWYYMAPAIAYVLSAILNFVCLIVYWDAYVPTQQQQQQDEQAPLQPPPQPPAQAPQPQPAAQEQVFQPPKMTVNRPPSPRYWWGS